MTQYRKMLDEQPNSLAAWEVKLAVNLGHLGNALPQKRMALLEVGQKSNPGILLDEIDADLYRVRWKLSGKPARYPSSTVIYKGAQRQIVMHRIIAQRLLGRLLSDDEIIDHRNHSTLDCTRINLRVGTMSSNMQNLLTPTGVSKLFGVSRRIIGKKVKWSSRITINYRTVCLGLFDNPEDAARAYDEAADKNGFLTRNFPTRVNA